MKLTILGNNGPYPASGGACSGYLLSNDSGNTNVLIECGSGVLANLPKHLTYEALNGIILSHLHFDHMSDLMPMQYALQFHPLSHPLDVWTPDSPESVWNLLKTIPAFALHIPKKMRIGEIDFTFFPVRHPVQTFALRAECDGRSFVYTGDTNEVEGLAEFAGNADLLLADAGLSERDWNENAPHLSALRCARLAQNGACKRLLLTHLNPRYTPEELEQEACGLRPEVKFVRIGTCYEI